MSRTSRLHLALPLLATSCVLAVLGCNGGFVAPDEAASDAVAPSLAVVNASATPCIQFFELGHAIRGPICQAGATGFRLVGLTTLRHLVFTLGSQIIGQSLSPAGAVGYEIGWSSAGVITSAAWLVRPPPGDPPIDFERVIIDSFQFSGASGADDLPVESVSLPYGKVTATYTSQDQRSRVPVPKGATRAHLSFDLGNPAPR